MLRFLPPLKFAMFQLLVFTIIFGHTHAIPSKTSDSRTCKEPLVRREWYVRAPKIFDLRIYRIESLPHNPQENTVGSTEA